MDISVQESGAYGIDPVCDNTQELESLSIYRRESQRWQGEKQLKKSWQRDRQAFKDKFVPMFFNGLNSLDNQKKLAQVERNNYS